MTTLRVLTVCAFAALGAGPALATTHDPLPAGPMDHANMDHANMDHSAMGHGDMSGAFGGHMAAMDRMMTDMPTQTSGNPDADFLLMMIPHHQSAIDMALVQLEHGTDPATRAIAQTIIDAQKDEIAQMTAMLAGMGIDLPEPPAQ